MANDLVWVKNIPFVLMNRSGHTYATLVYTTKLNINVSSIINQTSYYTTKRRCYKNFTCLLTINSSTESGNVAE